VRLKAALRDLAIAALPALRDGAPEEATKDVIEYE